jgi:hypothetical protein
MPPSGATFDENALLGTRPSWPQSQRKPLVLVLPARRQARCLRSQGFSRDHSRTIEHLEFFKLSQLAGSRALFPLSGQ